MAAETPGGTTYVAEVEFNDQFLQQPGGTPIDVSRFQKGNPAIPGEYSADLFVNTAWLGRRRITLRQIGDNHNNVQPCFDADLLQQIGVDLQKLSAEASQKLEEPSHACLVLASLIPDATAVFDNGEQRLDISVPQIVMRHAARGYVDPKYWSDGIPAALLQYNANVYRSESLGRSNTQSFMGVIAGLNYGPWRLRHNGNFTHSSVNGSHYQSTQTYLQRSLASIKSRLTLGEAFTDGSMFDSVGFRGIQLASDERMFPESQRGYAPTIHGVANSNALVQVRQNGNIIYTTNVAPGAFEINDLYPTGYGGDLDVSVTEADGRVQSFKVPYAAAVNALRPGVTQYSLTVGQYRNAYLSSNAGLAQGTIKHGFTNLLTGYGGLTIAKHYYSALLGAAFNTDFGALGFDITHASATLPDQKVSTGRSIKLSYSKLIAPTDTNITLAAYRYSSKGFLSLQDAMQRQEPTDISIHNMMRGGIQRGQFQAVLNQSLRPGWGSFYLSGSTVDYWNRSGRDTQFQAGYNNSFRSIGYGLSAGRQFDALRGRWDNRITLNISVPLSFGAHTVYSSTSLQHDSNGNSQIQQSISGSLGVDHALNYGLNIGHSSGDGVKSSNTVGGNLSYLSPYATLTANASKGTDYTQYGAGLAGGVVAYGGGVVLTPLMGETIGIVEAEGASGARVTAGSGLRVDRFGHALVSGLTPFSSNEVELDPKGLPMSVELKSTTQRVAPTAGAVVKLKFETEGGGRAVLLRASLSDGKPVPFGAQVLDADAQNVGTVAQAGRIVLRGVRSDTATLQVKWGEAAAENCSLSYALPEESKQDKQLWTNMEAVCRN
ncbi:fimbria/pilus outer membrane usher protein [Comamonas composti]|uniref:fimbria/pilus outer membrane usher protein n=1 Tax=Comamonas composti TaxID=408558 RepID=UPI000417DCAE|nr:fimbria/pilus outer membrane usher protein [Comamonas composti]